MLEAGLYPGRPMPPTVVGIRGAISPWKSPPADEAGERPHTQPARYFSMNYVAGNKIVSFKLTKPASGAGSAKST